MWYMMAAVTVGTNLGGVGSFLLPFGLWPHPCLVSPAPLTLTPPRLLCFHTQACPELFVDMAEAMGCVPAGAMLSSGAAVKALLGALRQLAADVGMPGSLKELVSLPRLVPRCWCHISSGAAAGIVLSQGCRWHN